MPFRPTGGRFKKGKRAGQKVYRHKGRSYSGKQVRAYHATGGFKRAPSKARRKKKR